MKTSVLLIMLIGLNAPALAGNTHPNLHLEKVGEVKKIKLQLENIDPAATMIALFDRQGHRLMSEKASTANYAKVINLSNLPNGSYELVITFSNHDLVQPIDLTKHGVDFDEKKRKIFFAPVVRSNQSNVDLSYFRGKITSVKVAIFNTSNDLVFEDEIKHVTKVERRYKLSSLPKGTYNVRVSTDYKTYYESVYLD